MTIETIDQGLCTGCGQCVLSCPMDVIRIDERTDKAVIKYVEDCMYCGFCIDCPEKAVAILPGPKLFVILGWG